MDQNSLYVTVLLFFFIVTGFTLYNNDKFLQISEDKNLIPLMNNQLFPSDFLQGEDPYTLECINGPITEDYMLTKKRSIIYSLSGSLVTPCDNTILDNPIAMEELSEKFLSRCIVKETDTYLCSSK